MHPFREGKNAPINKIWFIQSANLETHEISFEFPNNLNIPEQTTINMNLQDIKMLYNDLNQSLNDFIHEPSVHPLYGYMLRSKDPSKTGSHSNIVLESSLLQKIRQLYYHSSLSIHAQEMKYEKDIYITIYSYLDTNRHILFRKLFPHYIDSFNKLDTITSSLVKNIIVYAKIKKNHATSDKMALYVKLIYEMLNSQYQLNSNDRNLAKIITTFVLTHQWIDMYYNLFTSGNIPCNEMASLSIE